MTGIADPIAVTAGPISAWSLVAIVGWLVVVALVWLLFFAYGRNRGGDNRKTEF
ncbi:hypothetical protein [Halorussus lipolyticus]|uniref:hypothetical protein n=1 Tax=Halorussus lipolyticus TaxID=3034024 RepID=UPI0023E85EE0|nr:hypothetical protein [Halorussus sp. DT80]